MTASARAPNSFSCVSTLLPGGLRASFVLLLLLPASGAGAVGPFIRSTSDSLLSRSSHDARQRRLPSAASDAHRDFVPFGYGFCYCAMMEKPSICWPCLATPRSDFVRVSVLGKEGISRRFRHLHQWWCHRTTSTKLLLAFVSTIQHHILCIHTRLNTALLEAPSPE